MKKSFYRIKRYIQKYFERIYFNPSKYWEENGGESYYNTFHSEGMMRNEEIFLLQIEKHKPNSIIDIGCGYGRYLKVIRDNYPNIELVGTDISKSQITYAKKYLSDGSIKLIINDSTKFSFDDKYFDLALTYGLFGHIPPKLLKPIFLEIKRITKKGCFLEGKSNGKKISQNHVFTHNYDSIFKKFLISKEELGIDILYYLNFEKIIKPNDK